MQYDGGKVFRELLTIKQMELIAEGSTRSGKTCDISMWIVTQCIVAPAPIVARSFRKIAVDAKNSIGAEFLKMMQLYYGALYDANCWSKQEGCYRFQNGSEYWFCGCEPQRLPGYAQHIAHLDECTEIDLDSKMQIEQRTSHYILYSLNPNCMEHFVFDLMKRDTSTHLYVHSTYKDNYHLGQTQIDRIESRKPTPENIKAGTANEWYWKVYGEGIRCRREGTVYKNWHIIEDAEFPMKNACRIWGYGMDFGYSKDPTVLVLCAVFQNALYIHEVFASRGLSVLRNEQLPNRDCIQNRLEYHEISKLEPICSESAEPRTVEELQAIKYNIIPCKDKKIESGIDMVSRFTIFVTRSSQGAILEFQNYVRDEKTGKPLKEYDHRMDAMRYFVSEMCKGAMINAPTDEEEALHKKRLCRVRYPNKLSRRR